MPSYYQRVHPHKWPGVYYLELKTLFRGKPDFAYYIAYTLPNRKLKWEKVGLKSEGYNPAAAAEVRAERIKTIRHGGEVLTQKEIRQVRIKNNLTLKEVATAYFDGKGDRLKGRRTDINRWEKWLLPPLGKRTVASLTPSDVEALRRSMSSRAPQTQRNALELLRRICNYGAKHNLCPALKFTIEMPAVDNEKIEYLKTEEMTRLLEVLEAWPAQDVARMVKMAIFTGMRRGEIFNLEDDDIDREHGSITIREPKGGKTATIPLSPLVNEIITAQQSWRNTRKNQRVSKSVVIFPRKGDGQRRQDCSAVDRIKAEAKLPKNFRPFHGLRHHFAVTLANSGQVSLAMISELLTHKDVKVTKRYGQFLPETKMQAAELASQLIGSRVNGGSKEGEGEK